MGKPKRINTLSAAATQPQPHDLSSSSSPSPQTPEQEQRMQALRDLLDQKTHVVPGTDGTLPLMTAGAGVGGLAFGSPVRYGSGDFPHTLDRQEDRADRTMQWLQQGGQQYAGEGESEGQSEGQIEGEGEGEIEESDSEAGAESEAPQRKGKQRRDSKVLRGLRRFMSGAKTSKA